MNLTELLSKEAIIPALKNTTKEGVIREIAEAVVRAHPGQDMNELVTLLLEREKLGSTGIENGLAIPHAKVKCLDRIIIAFGKSSEGVPFEAHDGKPSRLFFVLLAPDSAAGLHLKALARLARLLKEEDVVSKLLAARTADDIYDIIKKEEEKLPC